MKNANLWTLIVFYHISFLEFILINFWSLWHLEVLPSWSLYVFKLWWGLSWLFDCFQNNINMFRVSNKEISFLRKERLTDKETCVIFWYLFNLFDVLGECKIILLEDSFKLIIMLGFVSSRYTLQFVWDLIMKDWLQHVFVKQVFRLHFGMQHFGLIDMEVRFDSVQ